VAVLLLLGAFVVPRAILWFDPVEDNRHRLDVDFLERGPVMEPGLWVGHDEGAFSHKGGAGPIMSRFVEGPSARWEAAWQSAASLPRDRWGNRWWLLHRTESLLGDVGMGDIRIYSAGPNGRFEWGEGDDIEVTPGGTLFELNWWPLAVLAGLVALPYLSIRMQRLPRRKTLVREACIASLAALGPVTLAFVVVVLGFTALDSLPLGWGVLPPRFVVFFTVAFVVWLLILGARLRLKAP